jgi:hypothetical protein
MSFVSQTHRAYHADISATYERAVSLVSFHSPLSSVNDFSFLSCLLTVVIKLTGLTSMMSVPPASHLCSMS